MTRLTTFFWVSVLYLIEGLPLGVFLSVVPVYLRLHGTSLRMIGVLNLLQLLWTFKVLWSPVVDRVATLRHWIVGALLTLAAAHTAFALLAHDGQSLHGTRVALFAIALGALAAASATQDIAIDASFIRLIKPGEEGWGNGVRVSAYRVGMVLGGGAMVSLAKWVAWSNIFVLLGGMCLILAGVILGAPQRTSTPVHQSFQQWMKSLWLWLRRPGAIAMFAFILLYKLGDATMNAMVPSFWVDMGMQPHEIGLINSTLGIAMTIVGALAGGWYISTRGIYRGLWVLGLSQAVAHLGYAYVAFAHSEHTTLYAASVLENFTQGLHTAALLAFITRVCDPEHAGTQYAALSAMFALTRTFGSSISGLLAEWMGYTVFFLFTFVLAFPAYIFLPRVRQRLA